MKVLEFLGRSDELRNESDTSPHGTRHVTPGTVCTNYTGLIPPEKCAWNFVHHSEVGVFASHDGRASEVVERRNRYPKVYLVPRRVPLILVFNYVQVSELLPRKRSPCRSSARHLLSEGGAGTGVETAGMRRHFVPKRRRRSASAPATERTSSATVEEPPADDAPASPWVSMATAGLEFFAKLLWLPEYHLLFWRELEENLKLAGGGPSQMVPSTYRARLHGEAADRYDLRRFQQKRDQLAGRS